MNLFQKKRKDDDVPTSQSLSKKEVARLVYDLYTDGAVTNELYAFGTMLLTEIQQRSTQIESKAGMILAWATAIVAFLFNYMKQSSTDVWFYIAFVGALFAMLAVISSFLVLRTRGAWAAPSDKSWLQESALSAKNPEEELKRYHVRVIHNVRQIHLRLTEEKAEWLVRSEFCLTLAAASLFVAIVLKLFFA